MARFKYKAAFVVATKDRPQELRTMLKSLARQSYPPDQIVIVDSGAASDENLAKEFRAMSIMYIHYTGKPSASAQRNLGLSAVEKDMALVGFIDDDTEFEPDALERMMTFWEKASGDLGGAAFNMVNHPELTASLLKTSSFAVRLGLYSNQKGEVLPSGFHTMIGYVDETTFVKWLPTTAAIWRRIIFDENRLDEWFEGYSYLEDLDFSYCVGKKYKLAVVADAKYYHYHASTGRGSSYVFGKREVLNRVYFVKKYRELSIVKCHLGLIVRMAMSFLFAIKEGRNDYIKRVGGNIAGLCEALKKFRE